MDNRLCAHTPHTHRFSVLLSRSPMPDESSSACWDSVCWQQRVYCAELKPHFFCYRSGTVFAGLDKGYVCVALQAFEARHIDISKSQDDLEKDPVTSEPASTIVDQIKQPHFDHKTMSSVSSRTTGGQQITNAAGKDSQAMLFAVTQEKSVERIQCVVTVHRVVKE